VKSEIIDCVIIFIFGAVASYLLCFPFIKVSKKYKLTVPPGGMSIHDKPLPFLGGAALFSAFALSLGFAALLGGFRPEFHDSSEALGVLLGSGIVFITGQIDDLIDMSPPAKVAGQVLGAMFFYFMGVTMYQFKIPLAGFIILSHQTEPLITALWVIGIANAINLIDGLDGLAAGIVAIASLAFCIYSLQLENLGYIDSSNIAPMIAAISCGICVGFLPHNFHPAKVIMGDAGALFLGSLMAAATMVVGGRTPDVSGETYFFFAPLFIPFFILGVPILDTAFSIIRRAASGRGVAHKDKDHLHHRLLRLGHGQRRAVGILWVWTALLSAFVLYPTFDPHGNAWAPFAVAFLGALLYTWFRPGVSAESEEEDRELADRTRETNVC
jgi:UDP-GlcNAc:undecaprenyl-phosphate GlcNAc-1-phosphate transferase